MLGRFAVPQLLDLSETDPYPIFDHMIDIRSAINPLLLRCPKAIAIDSKTKEIYVLQNDPACISVFSDIGKFLQKLSLESIRFPWGIAIHEDNIYITDSVSPYIYHFRNETMSIYLVAKHGGYGQSIGKFYRLKQLTFSSNGDIFIADYWNNRVQILDSNLHYQQPISHHSMKFPEDVKMTAEEVYVLCWRTPFVYVFSLSGEKIRSLVIPLHGAFFCLDSFGNIMITNRTTDQINVFTKNGTLISTLVEPGLRVGFIQDAEGIALIDDFKLIVSSSSTRSLCIFS